jgi:hypothetical protein
MVVLCSCSGITHLLGAGSYLGQRTVPGALSTGDSGCFRLGRPNRVRLSTTRAQDHRRRARLPTGSRRHLIIRLIIQAIRRDPPGSDQIDEASNVSRPDPTGADQIDAEHQATDLAVRPLCANLLDSAGLGVNSLK